MSIARTGQGALGITNVTSITAPTPTGMADGDYVVIAVTVPCTNTAAETTEPLQTITNWTKLAGWKYVNDTNAVSVWGRFKDAGWSTMPTISTSHAQNRFGAVSASYSGVDTTTPMDVTPVFTGTTSSGTGQTSNVMTGVTIATAGAMLLSFCIVDSSTDVFSPTVPSGMTSVGTTTNGAAGVGGRGSTLAEELRASTGATGTRTWTHSVSVGNGGYNLALRPSTIPQAAGTVPAVVTVAGALTANLKAAGTAAAAVTVAGTLTSKLPVSGTTAAVVTVAGNVIRTPPPVSGQADAVVTVVGNVITKVGLVGQADAVVTVSGTLGPFRLALAGTAPAAVTLSGTITSRGLISGTSGAVVTVSGTLGPFRLAVSGTTAAAVVTVAGNVRSIYGVSGTAAAVSTVSGGLLVTGKPGQGSEVLVLFDPDEVLTGGRVTYYQFDLLDPDENLIGQLQGVASGDVSFDAYASVKGTGKLEVYTDPENAHVAEGQPDFVGVQINTPLGPQATATGGVPSPPFDHIVAVDIDAADVSFGDRIILTDSTGVPKESTAFLVTQKVSASGSTTLSFTPDAQAAIVTGDIVKAVSVGFQKIVDWLNVRIRPMIRIQRLGGGDDPAGTLTPAGVFLCAAPVEKYTATGLRRVVELVDKLSILDQDIASGDPAGISTYSAVAGANIITLVQALITETGELTPAIQPDSKALAAPMFWDIGTTRLKIINDLLDVGGYFSLFCDGYGQFQAVPYVQPSDRVPVYESIAPFSDGPESLMDPDWTRDRDIYSIPNRVLVVGQGDGTTAALTSVATNVDPSSPYSFPSRGRWITKVITGVEAASQAVLDTIARARLADATSVTNQITLSHLFLPDLHVNSVVKFVNPDSGLDVKCYVVTTTIPFDPTALCQTVMRVVA